MSLSHSPSIVTNGLILCLDAANTESYPRTGSAWTDLSNNGNNATLINGPSFSSANRGVLSFNGSTQYVTSAFTNRSFTQLTFIAFLNRITTGAAGAGIIFNRGGAGGTTGMNIGWANSNNLGYHWNDDGATYSYDSGLAIPLNTWSYCALSVSPTNAIFCVNGVIVNRTYNHSSTTIGVGMQIAADAAASRYYQSIFATACLYNRALTPTEILQNYNATKGRFGL